MKIAVASGKGGTGKTTIATNLASALARNGNTVTYIDCDVEEPNGHIFLQPVFEAEISVGIPVPKVDEQKCDYCRNCAEICQYSAIVCIPDNVLLFPELCHGCGGCSLVCTQQAIREIKREIGVVEKGIADNIQFIHGRLHIGQAMSPPLIRAVKQEAEGKGIFIFDSPPGTSCPVIESIRGADFTILVTEPTPFGLNDLKLAIEMLRELDQPFGIVINRSGMGNEDVEQYCQENDLDILLKVPDDRKIAEAYSRGQMAINVLPEYPVYFKSLFYQVQKRISNK